MEGGGALRSRLSCPCTVCITWRRLGGELSQGHHHQGFLIEAVRHLRSCFNDLLDYRSVQGIADSAPVADGVSILTPATPVDNRELAGKSPDQSGSGSPAKSPDKSEERRGSPPEEKIVSARPSSPVPAKKSKKDKKSKKKEKRSRSRTPKVKSESKRSRRTSPSHLIPVKEEDSGTEKEESSTLRSAEA